MEEIHPHRDIEFCSSLEASREQAVASERRLAGGQFSASSHFEELIHGVVVTTRILATVFQVMGGGG